MQNMASWMKSLIKQDLLLYKLGENEDTDFEEDETEDDEDEETEEDDLE